jgi:4a-hydroxytetrahydrobiopterin dehydratase
MSVMSEWIGPSQFHAADGVEDWRVLGSGLSAHFRTGSFSLGAELVDAVCNLAADAEQGPDIDLRNSGVTVRLMASEDGLRQSYIDLARQISGVARDVGAVPDPTAAQDVQFTIDATDPDVVRPFWAALLGYQEMGDRDLVDPRRVGPPIWFQEMGEPRTVRNRLHVDVFVPHDQAEARVAAAVEAGGRVIYDEHAPAWWTLADPEGNEADVASWMGRD